MSRTNRAADEDDDNICRTCGEWYADGGDGYDGECPTCADATFDQAERDRGAR